MASSLVEHRKTTISALRIRTWFRFILHAFHDQRSTMGYEEARKATFLLPPLPVMAGETVRRDIAEIPSDEELIKMMTSALQRWVQAYAQLPDEVVALTKISARDYWLGNKPPRSKTLDAFEMIFPGSKDVYENGPNGEPVWAILAGDLSEARSYLNSVVGCPKGEVWSYHKYFDSLLQGLVAPVFLKDLNISDLSQNEAVGFHPVLLTWINEQLRLVEDDPEQLLPTPYVADQILAVFALWNLCLAERGPIFLELEWLLVGLCRGMVFSAFDDQIEQTILEFVKADAEQLDSVFSQANPGWPSFTERWNSEPLQDLKFK